MKIREITIWMEEDKYPAKFEATSRMSLGDDYLQDDECPWIVVSQYFKEMTVYSYFPKRLVRQFNVEEYPDDVEFV